MAKNSEDIDNIQGSSTLSVDSIYVTGMVFFYKEHGCKYLMLVVRKLIVLIKASYGNHIVMYYSDIHISVYHFIKKKYSLYLKSSYTKM